MSIWIGLRDVDLEGVYVWADADLVSWVNWGQGQPDNYEDNEDCVSLRTGDLMWYDSPCSSVKAYVCQPGEDMHNI